MENLPRHMSVMSEKKKPSLSVKIRQRGRINPRQAILYRKSGILLSEKGIAQLQFEKTIIRCCINLPNFLSHLSHQSFMANKQVGITLLGSNASCTLAQVQLAKRRGWWIPKSSEAEKWCFIAISCSMIIWKHETWKKKTCTQIWICTIQRILC